MAKSTVPAELRERFVRRCARDARRLRAVEGTWAASPDVRRIVHSLSGTGGMFGFAILSHQARRVDDALAAGGDPSAAERDALIEILLTLSPPNR